MKVVANSAYVFDVPGGGSLTLHSQLTLHSKEIADWLSAELDDARRYRFIRDTPWGPDLVNVIQMQMNSKWDSAIDAAMEHTK